MEKTKLIVREKPREATISRVADAHCHLFDVDPLAVESAIRAGVQIMVTNGVDTRTNMQTLGMHGKTGIYCMIGVHPNNAVGMGDEELDFNLGLIRSNSAKIVGIGEIGLDYTSAKTDADRKRQVDVFKKMLDAASKIRKPVSIHSREAIRDVFSILESYTEQKAHLHFFEGREADAKLAQKRGYYISVPYLKSAQRADAVRNIDISNIMVESDSPTAGSTPSDARLAVEFVAGLKGIDVAKAASATFENTKRLFNIDGSRFMRSGL